MPQTKSVQIRKYILLVIPTAKIMASKMGKKLEGKVINSPASREHHILSNVSLKNQK